MTLETTTQLTQTPYPRYDRYKDSGVDWLGNVPAEWQLGRISSFFIERRTKVSDKDYPALSVTKTGVFPQWANVAKSNDGDNRKLVKQGDFVINSRSDRKGSSGIAMQDGSVSLINIVLKPKGIEPRYSEYLFKNYSFIEEFYRVGHGIVADLWTTRFSDIKNSLVSLPSYIEQTKIANFLDQKTVQIDQAIALKKQQIAKLKEYQQIVIQNAVTKGLNPNVPMKDSGVDWIGDIPEYWQLKRLKYVVMIRKRIIGYEGVNVLSITQTGVKVKDITSGEGQLAMDYSKYQIVNKGDFAMNHMDLLTGYIDISEFDGVVSPDYRVFTNELSNEIKNNYLLALFQMGYKQKILFKYGRGVSMLGRWRLPAESFNNFVIPIPLINEQEEIIAFINFISITTRKAIGLQTIIINRLKEYKTILINQAVTGKIKVG